MGIEVHACTWEAETGGSQVQDKLGLRRKLEASLGYVETNKTSRQTNWARNQISEGDDC